MCTGSYYMIEASLLALAVGCEQSRCVDKRGFLVVCVHCRIVRRSMDSETVEEFLVDIVWHCILIKAPFPS